MRTMVEAVAGAQEETSAKFVVEGLKSLRTTIGRTMPVAESYYALERTLDDAIDKATEVLGQIPNAGDEAAGADVERGQRLEDAKAVERAAARAVDGGEGA